MPEKSRSKEDWRALLADQVDSHGKLFYAIAYGILRDESLAKDVCQQAFLKALELQDQIRRQECLCAWLCKVVSTESFAVRRRRKLERQTLFDGRLRSHEDVDEIEQWEKRNDFLEATDSLAEPMRTIVIMRIVNKRTGVETAKVLGYSLAYVSRQLHKAMVILRLKLKDWHDSSDD